MKQRYDAICRELRAGIEGGTYPFQGFLPSERELTEQFGCSHNTVRRALSILREQGYVQPVHGKGVRVVFQAPARETFYMGDIESFSEARSRSRFVAETRVVSFEWLVADEGLAEQTGFAVGEELVAVERVRRIDGEALILDRNLFPTSVVPGLTREIAENSIYAYLEGELGLVIAMSKRVITGERATARDRELLDLDDVDYLAVVSSQTFDAQGTLIEYTQSRHRLDHFCFRDTAVRQKV